MRDASKHRTPIIILGGSDRRPSELPPDGLGKHPLIGYKGVDIKIGDRPLISMLADRLRDCGAFEPIVIVGPERVYRAAGVSGRVIDTDGGFGENIRVGVETLRREHAGSALAITTCDILPRLDELAYLLADYRRGAPCDLWYPVILTPEDASHLGAFGWKPKYRVAPEPAAKPRLVLPGHLAIVDPDALRLEFLYRLLQVGYRTRNRPIAYRRSYMIRQTLWRLLVQDLEYLLELRLPNVTWSVLAAGIPAARKLRDGTITRGELEDAVRRIFVKSRHRRRHPDRRVSLPLLEGLSLAEDIDTVEEARQLGGTGGSA